ncbi:MAG: helix-turn-helix transcriptional regulator [Desulfobulbaceae bacterium]|nr:MAG: helix-turn-helix transcriptional regulator [Desulfobulbaceae bacterium]
MNTENIYQVAINSLSVHIAILDEHGIILETNRAWQEFGRANGLQGRADSVGVNYLDICDRADQDAMGECVMIARGIRAVIAGNMEEFFIDYPCHAPHEERWYALRVVRFQEPGRNKVILSHENITPLLKSRQQLQKKEQEIRDKARDLEEANIALKVLLERRDQDKQRLEENVLANVRELILPYMERLMESRLPPQERTYVAIVKDRLAEIVSPFLNRLAALHTILTPQEIQVATMVREGRTSQEIADALLITASGVAFHRKQIRKKLGLTGTKSNLRSFLLSLV